VSLFDAEAYFANQTAGITGKSITNPSSLTEEEQLIKAEQARKQERALQNLSAARTRNQEESLSGKMGMSPYSSLGETVNLGASLVSGTARLAGDITALPMHAIAAAAESGISQEEIDAFANYNNKTASPKELELLKSKERVVARIKEKTGDFTDETVSKMSVLDRLEGAARVREGISKVNEAFDVSSIIDTTKRDGLDRALTTEQNQKSIDSLSASADMLGEGEYAQAAGEAVPALADLIMNAGSAILSNKAAVAQYVFENLPQLAIGAQSKSLLAAANVGYAADPYNEGMRKYAEENNGALPPEYLRQEMAIAAASTALAEHASDLFTLGKAFPGLTKNATSIKGAVSTGPLKSAVGIAGVGVNEAATEGVQTYTEGVANLSGSTGMDIYKAATIGGASGATIATPGQIGQAFSGVTDVVQERVVAREEKLAVEVEALAKASETGDVSAYVADPKSKSYAPDTAIAALMEFSKKEGADVKQKETALKQATELLTQAKAELNDGTENPLSKEGEETNRRKLSEYTARVAKGMSGVDRDGKPYTEETFAREQAGLALLTKMDKENPVDTFAARLKEEKDRISKLELRVADAQKVYDAFTTDTNNTVKDDPEAQVNVANTTIDPAVPEQAEKVSSAVNHVISMAMHSPNSLSAERATALADNLSNSLTESQREFMREFSAAQVARKSAEGISGVNRDVMEGSKERKQLGINNYQSQFADAVQLGNRDKAVQTLASLNAFGKKHLSKMTAMETAFNELTALKSNNSITIAPDENGIWKPTDKKISPKQQAAGAGYVVQRVKSASTLAAVKAEVSAISSAQKAMTAAGKLAFKITAPAAIEVPAATAQAVVAPAVQEKPKEKVATPVAVVVAPTQAAPVVAPRRGIDVAAAKVTPKQFVVGQKWTDTKGNSRTLTEVVGDALTFDTPTGGKTTVKVARFRKSNWTLNAESVVSEATKEDLDELKGLLENTRWDEVGGRLLRDTVGKVSGRTKWTSSMPELAAVLANTGINPTKAIELLSRAEDGHPPLTPKQQGIVDGLLEALNEMKQDPETFQFEEEVTPAEVEVEAQPQPKTVSKAEPNKTVATEEASPALNEAEIPDADWAAKDQLILPEDELANIDLGQNDDFDLGTPPTYFGDLPDFLTEIAGDQYDFTERLGSREEDENGDTVLSEDIAAADSTTHPGMLTIFNNAKDAALKVSKNGLISEAVRLTNLVKASFTQRALDAPLLKVQSFLGKWAANPALITQFLPRNLQLNGEQQAALDHFIATTTQVKNGKNWLNDIESLFPKKKDEFSDPETNFLLHFIDESDPTAEVDQNLKTAIAFAAYTWVAENAGSPLVKDMSAINRMLGLDSDTPPVNNVHQVLHDVGERRSLVTRALGQRVLMASGITLKSNQEPENYKGQLENALGVVALGLLLKRGLVQPQVRSGVQMAAVSQARIPDLGKNERESLDAYMKDSPDGGKAWVEQLKKGSVKTPLNLPLEAVATYFLQQGWVKPDYFGAYKKLIPGLTNDHAFIRVAQRTQKATPAMLESNPNAKAFQTVTAPVNAIHEANKGTGGILGKVFGVDTLKYGTVLKRPSLSRKKGEEAKARKLKGTKLMAPTEQAEALGKVEDQASYFRPEMFTLLEGFIPFLRNEMFGVREEGDVLIHVENRLANTAKNEGLTRQWETLQTFKKDLENTGINPFGTPLYFLRDAWKNQRVGLLGEINPQTQKVTRVMVASANWQVDVPVMSNYVQGSAPVFTETEPKAPKPPSADRPVKMELTEKQAKDPAWVERAEGLHEKALADYAAAQSVYEGRVKIYETQLARHKKNLAAHAKALVEHEKGPEAAQAKEDLMYLGIAEAFGIKSENKWNADTLKEIKSRLSEDVIMEGVAAIRKSIFPSADNGSGELSLDEQQAVASAVQRGGEKVHSLDALVALATYYEAMDNGQSTAKITLMREVDGKTNGPALTMLQLGAGLDAADLMETLEKAGMYTLESGIQGYTAWYNTEGQKRSDMYESLAKIIVDKLAKNTTEPEVAAAIYVITGDLTKDGAITSDGRSLVKTPLTEMMFGSQIENTVAGMAQNFTQSVYDRIEKIANNTKIDGGQKEAEINTLFLAIQTLTGDKNIPANPGVEQALLYKLTLKHKEMLQDAYRDTVGQAVKAGMEEKYAVFLSRRESINQGASIAYTLYEIAYNAAVELVTRRLIEANKMPFTEVKGVKTPRRSLSKSELEMVDEMVDEIAPRHHTAMSLADKDPHFGMLMAKVDTSLSQDPRYASTITLGSAVPAVPTRTNNGVAKSMKVAAFERALASPGVATLVGAIHSTDSAIALRAYKQLLGALNVHDALGLSLDEFIEGSRRLNEATFHTMLDYSAIGEIEAAVHRTILGFAKVAPTLGVNSTSMASLTALQKSLAGTIFSNTGVWEKDALKATLDTLTEHRKESETIKLTVLAQLGVMDQYPNQLGQYVVTKEDRELAEGRLLTVVKTVPVPVTAALKKIRGALYGRNAELAELPASKEEKAAAAAINKANSTFEGASTLQLLNVLEDTLSFLGSESNEGFLHTDLVASLEKLQEVLANPSNPNMNYSEAVAKAEIGEVVGAHIKQMVSARLNEQGYSVWGKLGTPIVPSDRTLARTLEANPSMTGMDLVNLVRDSLAKAGQIKKTAQNVFDRRLIRRIELAMQIRDVKVVYVTEGTPPEGAQAVGSISGAYGWFTMSSAGGSTIYIKSPQFEHSNVNHELLLHEMTHAVLLSIIEQAKITGDTTPEGRAVQALEKLLLTARAKVMADPRLATKYSNAVENVHEFMSWGMTNAGFQADVLNSLDGGKTGELSLFRKLIRSIVNMLFPNNAERTTGMHVMVERTTVLLSAAAKQGDMPITSVVTTNQNAPESVMNRLSLENLYDGLGTSTRALSAEFDGHLRGLIDSITSKLHLPTAALREAAMKGQGFSTEENWLRYVATGQAPYAASALNSDFNFTQQEALLAEEIQATVEAALNTHEGSVSRSQKEILRTFRAAEKQLTAKSFHDGDWTTATPEEREKAQGLYDFVFDRSSGADGRSEYLSRFVAISLAYEPMYKALKEVRVESEVGGKTVVERLTAVMYAILDIFQRWTIKHTGNEQETLKKLVENLVDIEAKRRSRLAAEQDGTENAAVRAAKGMTESLQKGMSKVGNSKYLRKNKLTGIKGSLLKAAGITLAVVGDRNQEAVMNMVERARDASLGGKAGIIGSLWTEMLGETDSNTPVYQLLRAAQRNEQVRKELRTEVSAYAASGFKNGKDFSRETKRALTRVLLRAGLSTLIEDYSLAEIEGLLTNSRGERKAAIAKHEAALANLGGETTYYINQAKLLALYKTKGVVRSANLVMNAYNIANLAGTSKNNTVDDVLIAQATPEVKALIALYSLEFTNASDTRAVGDLLREENNREEGNGVDLVLRLHKKMEEESKARIFQGAESLMVHGYTPEIFNPHNDLIVDSLENEAELKAMGYERKKRVIELDPTDPDRSARYVYVQKYGGLQAHITGVTSLTSRQHKGQSQVGAEYAVLDAKGELTAKYKFGVQMDRDRTMAVDGLFSKPIADPKTLGTNWMAPVMNTHGEIADFRYLMTEENKDDLLDRNNDFDEILGVMAGSIFDKETTLEQNRKAVQAIKDQYDLEFTKNTKIYLRVGANDKDPEMAEIYRTFPKEMHENIREIWGEDAMYVRRDQMDVLFGYRKSSIAGVFEKKRQHRNVMQNITRDVIAALLLVGRTPEDAQRAYANQPLLRDLAAGRKLRIAGDIWDAFVSEAKDILVVKTGVTLLGNISSNVVQLLWHGVSPAQIIRDHRIALKGALSYRGDTRRLMAIENMLKSGYNEGDKVALQREAVTLKDSLAKNPVKGLIDAGLMPTIVEDVTLDEDAYSYQSMLANKLEGITSRIPAPLRKLGKGMYMSHDTQLYHIMSQGTQLSDFVARYTLYQHETARKENPLSNAEAIRRASQAFVNYDIPTNRTVQWMNDKGLFMFTKYYIRIQKTLLMLFREQPARALGVLMLGEFLSGVATPMDSIIGIGNPLQEGALLYPTSLDDMLTVKLMMSPF
jgi:hypothetical protein